MAPERRSPSARPSRNRGAATLISLCLTATMAIALASYLALAHRDYRRLIVSQFLSLTGTQMQVVAINWHVYLLTKSPLALGFVGLTRVVPIVVFSLWGGVVADRHDRRRVMVMTQIAMTLVALGLAAFTFAGRETLWLLYLLNALGASAVAFDGPSRQALIPRLVPADDLPGAHLDVEAADDGLVAVALDQTPGGERACLHRPLPPEPFEQDESGAMRTSAAPCPFSFWEAVKNSISLPRTTSQPCSTSATSPTQTIRSALR